MQWKLAGAGLLALGTVLGAGTSAEAAQGCGPGFHRGFYGFCRPNPYRPFFRPYGFYRPYGFRPAFYGPRRFGWGGGWGWRRAGWGGPGWRHGWHGGGHGGWHGGWHRGGWHHRW